MKREILFRAKAINRVDGREYKTNYKNGDWVYGLVSRLYDERFENLPAEMTNTNGISGIDVDYKTIGQYTGLIDKNGKKIFEGDIVAGYFDHEKVIGYIFYGSDAAFFIQRKGLFGIGLNNASDWLTIIGNIHANPELLDYAGNPIPEDILQPVLKPATEPLENFQIMNG